ncbi:transporter substrate-binding domain-containing protein [Roseibium algae]|uniref:Transporter substrate-binding domain-containing protein n=1 Tax=Roseibium algae TaxID=3123038 RepID=A0ABU8TS19_9HYPH
MHSKNWPVGVIMSETGVTGAIEKTQIAAVRLAINEINAAGGVAGRLIEPAYVDPQSTPKLYCDLTRDLCRDRDIRVFFGGHMSSTRKAMMPVIEAQNAVLFYPTLYEGFEYSPNCIYTGAAPNQNSVPLVDYLYDEVGKSIFLVGSDYVYPYESNRIVADLFASKGGRVLDELYVPLALTDAHIKTILERIDACKPDQIYSTIVGDGIVAFYNAFKEAGYNPETKPISSQSTSEIDVVRMQPGAADGHIIAAPFFNSLERASAKAFTQALSASTPDGLPTTAPAEAAYFSVHLYAKALALAGADTRNELLAALYEVEFDAPQGPVRIDRFTNHAHLWPRVARIREGKPYEIVCKPTERVAPDPFLVKILSEELSESYDVEQTGTEF